MLLSRNVHHDHRVSWSNVNIICSTVRGFPSFYPPSGRGIYRQTGRMKQQSNDGELRQTIRLRQDCVRWLTLWLEIARWAKVWFCCSWALKATINLYMLKKLVTSSSTKWEETVLAHQSLLALAKQAFFLNPQRSLIFNRGFPAPESSELTDGVIEYKGGQGGFMVLLKVFQYKNILMSNRARQTMFALRT